MCSIFQLLPGFNIPDNLLFNAVHNNEHGYGILFRENKKIRVDKAMPEKVDPEALGKILKDHDDVERWVHLRNRSEGDVSINNVQPIQIFESKKRSLWFVHNGTIYSGLTVPDNQKKFLTETLSEKIDSDSRKFAVGKLMPLFARFQGQHGFGDLTDPFLQEWLSKLWVHGHGRAAIISSDQDPLLFNASGWEKIKTPDGEFLASNNEYFEKLTRGTLFMQRKAEEDKKRGNVETKTVFGRGVKPSGLYELTYPPFEETISLSENIETILEEYDLYSPEGFINMSFLESSEVKKLFTDHLDDAVVLFLYLTNMLKDEVQETTNLKEQIEILKGRNQSLIKETWENGGDIDQVMENSVHVG